MKVASPLRLPITLFGWLLIGAGLAACSNQSGTTAARSTATATAVALITQIPTGAQTAPPIVATRTPAPTATSAPAPAPPTAPVDPAQALWGRWIGRGTCLFNGSSMTVDMVFSPQHSYSQTTMCSGINGPSTYRILITGNYEVLPASAQIHFTNMRSDPERLPNGYPYLAGDSETDNYQLTNGNATLALSNPICPACTVVYHR